jgi:hypothetical protein
MGRAVILLEKTSDFFVWLKYNLVPIDAIMFDFNAYNIKDSNINHETKTY